MAMTPEDFLAKDYELRIRYLTDHLQRMWTRFNFFVTLEAALLGGRVLLVSDKPNPMVGVAGMILSAVWYLMGAQDRFLADFYRWQVKQAAERIRKIFDKEPERQDTLLAAARTAVTDHVGRIEDELVKQYRASKDEQMKRLLPRALERLSSWRSRRFSTTHLAAWISLIAAILWLLYFCKQLAK